MRFSGTLARDFFASIVVFLVALPLCLGIAIACGVPPALGLITGIVGGIIVGSISGSPLQVSGPAAGLTVVVFELVTQHGISALGPVVLLAGVMQIVAGFFKLGRWFRAVSPPVIHGMLAGIGVLICASQFHVMFDGKPKSSGLPNLLTIPSEIWNAVTMTHGSAALIAGGLGVLTIAILVLWKQFKLDKYTKMPGALPATVIVTLIAWVFAIPVNLIDVPTNLLATLQLPTTDALIGIFDARLLIASLTLAIVASAETLLSAAAVDRMHQGARADYNKELRAQGIGNFLCGLVGALPMTGVIVRSGANVQAGAQTRLATIMHGVWILAAVVAIPFVLKLVPVACLAGLLVYTGIKLVDIEVFRKLRAYGKFEVGIYTGTVVMIVATDLLTGVLVGFVLALIKLVLTMTDLEIEQTTDAADDKVILLRLKGSATFLGLPKLAEYLDAIPAGTSVSIILEDLVHIDHACLELVETWEQRHTSLGGTVVVDKKCLLERYKSPADAQAC